MGRESRMSTGWVAVACLCTLAALGAGPADAQEPVRANTRAVLSGTVYDSVTEQRVRLAVVRVVGTSRSVLTDDDGRFRLTLAPGPWALEIRAFGYANATLTPTLAAEGTEVEVPLQPRPVGVDPVEVTVGRDRAREIIERAIARKQDALAGIHDYRYDGYVKLAVRDLDEHPDSAKSVLLIAETKSTSYWEVPGHYQETILARRQSSNVDPEQLFAVVGEVVDFNRDRVDLERYSMVSPIADDALKHYTYAILDTLQVDGRSVFRLAIRPASEAEPLFLGVIDIADETYQVLSIDVGLNGAARFTYLSNVRYRQRLRQISGGRWMPHEIGVSAEVRLSVPIPGIPRHIGLEQVASLDNFRFDQGNGPRDLGRMRIVVDAHADDVARSAWTVPVAVELSPLERTAWERIDSIGRDPGFGTRFGRGLGRVVSLLADGDHFRFNRVDAAYLGAAREWRSPRGAALTSALGYAFGSEAWQYRLGGRVRLSAARDLWAGVFLEDATARRPTFTSSTYDPTLFALAVRLDPLDYYRERGVTISAGATLLPFARLDVRYRDLEQSSLPTITDFALLDVTRAQRPNPPIVEGRLRSLSATLAFDSRPVLWNKGVETRLPVLPLVRASVSAEIADPGLVSNDFSFRRYSVELERRQRTFSHGITTLTGAAGIATGDVPPQRYFSIDFGTGFALAGEGFGTLGETSFSGNRAAMVAVRHDFDRLPFLASGLPLVQDIPFTLSVHGGAFWTDFVDHVAKPADAALVTARDAYTELGFGVGNLTPFLSPFNLQLDFSWQLSSYATKAFVMRLGLTP